MLAKNSYLVMAGMFFGFALFAHTNNDFPATAILSWFGLTFCFFWFLHYMKAHKAIDWAGIVVRDSFLKYLILSPIWFPFLLIKYFSLLTQSLSGEAIISQVTDRIFIGQQLLWFHRRLFRERNIGAVLDVTVENMETSFIARNDGVEYLRIPVLDKTSPSMSQLEAGVTWGLDQISQGRNLYVHCGAGHERSAMFVCALLLRANVCKTSDDAMSLIRRNRPKARFVADQQAVLQKWFSLANADGV